MNIEKQFDVVVIGAGAAFVVLILVLTLRPAGLLGERVADRA